MFRTLIVHSALLVLLTTGCHPKDRMMDASAKKTAYSQDDVEAMYRKNPNPQRRYAIAMVIENPPGAFDHVKWYAQYEAPDCVYLMNPVEGVHSRPMTTIELTFTKDAEARYSAVLYEDAMLDEDYFGTGVCRWQLTFARVELKATGATEETTFVSTLSSDELKLGQAVRSYFWKGSYPKDPLPGYSDSGFPHPETFKPELRDELFSIVMTGERGEP
jgi:hypothetical protein